MRRTLLTALILILALPAANAHAAGYATIMFGRGILDIGSGSNCSVIPGSVNLFTIADDVKQEGMTATIPMTYNQPGTCQGGDRYASWADLARLRDSYGWSVVPRGVSGTDMTTVSDPAKISAEVCGALQLFQNRGFTRAWGMFAWPANRWTDSLETKYAVPCYAFGRRYTATRTNPLPVPGPTYWAYTVSVNGGRCSNITLSCHTMAVQNNRDYMPPRGLIATVNAATAGRWALIQWYKLVSGRYGTQTSGKFAWDCTSTNPNNHWTARGELYCYNDFRRVIRAIDARITVTDPAGVAIATGRRPARLGAER